ncbi:dehydrodolichyl diphosphate synthase complex subunit Nus1-like [Penaeus japonicus]|uniref:dehydrodolichyl diphosphate synthase complex subunit Nus1-like n=1 Tax=Penaeus japonicus TaxID=27405 RepID=UPI001C715907|nr:dehydrodolichyl diphosphate synthase complex subunit Nus1-like [Penaeus japonicus]XP_042866189.1 dehydrodolichyl diphosphate synthase complex subunit Nus1-like [Penaeus japonicus]XP_042866191.1 dehydrodolichyl diphosphate synthase complex subunit Nus1-like [Penaeus japonicus]
MDVLLPVFQLLYFVAHFLASLALSVLDTFYLLHRVFLHVCAVLRGSDSPVFRIQADAAQLKKIPQHVGLVCTGKQVYHITNLANVISWAVGYGVRYVSLYDLHGALKRQRSVILQHLEEACADVNYTMITHSCEMNQAKDVVENNRSGPHVIINLLSLTDGRGSLSVIARQLSSEPGKVNQELLESWKVTRGQPDPEVVITIGEPISTMGFLPWQIRLSEFFAIPSLNRFEYSDFQTILRQYSKCEQRCGK